MEDADHKLDLLQREVQRRSASSGGLPSFGRAALVVTMLSFWSVVWAQKTISKPVATDSAAETPKSEPPKDILGRTTPRGAVLGFLRAAHKSNAEIAVLYLNTPLRGADAQALAQQLAVVLDRRLPARLNLLSDEPEGSLPDPLRPDEDLVGTIETSKGDLEILLERVDRGKLGKAWLFSRKTLDAIPGVFQELSTPPVEKVLPEFLVKTRLASVPLFEWVAVFLGMPFLYLLTGVLNRLLGLGVGTWRRYLLRNPHVQNPRILSPPIRLLLLALSIYWMLSKVGLPLLARQFWSTTVIVIVIVASAWLLMLFASWGERYIMGRRPTMSGSAAVLRLLRRVTNTLIFFTALLFALYHFGFNPTAALAGLGVGGIAVALAAQKTLENVIAGVSLIADHAVRVGDTLKLGDVVGTVVDVGLRSTSIRTFDRTVVSVPNGQMANMSLEILSARDKFWFHPLIGLRYETSPAQLRSIVDEINDLLAEHSKLDAPSVRVNFLRLSAYSLDVEIFAYVFASDWAEFLQIQQDLLLSVIGIVHQVGAEVAFPSQTTYLSAEATEMLARLAPRFAATRQTDALNKERGVHH
jgi:MscS family membrane protein